MILSRSTKYNFPLINISKNIQITKQKLTIKRFPEWPINKWLTENVFRFPAFVTRFRTINYSLRRVGSMAANLAYAAMLPQGVDGFGPSGTFVSELAAHASISFPIRSSMRLQF